MNDENVCTSSGIAGVCCCYSTIHERIADREWWVVFHLKLDNIRLL